MISRQSSTDSTRTYCPVSEKKLVQRRKYTHILLKHIHSKVLQHVRMEKLLEPYEVLKFIQQIKKLYTDQPDIESFRKKIRKMLLTINDSLMEFEQAIISGEVALYSIDIGQNCDFTQQSSVTSVGEVPSFSSIELTNTDFMTVPNNSQNCIELDCSNPDLKMRKEELPNNFICGYSHSKLNTVDLLDEQNIKQCKTIQIVKTSSNKKHFKKSVKKNNEMKINQSKYNKVILNNKNIKNTHSSIYQDRKGTESTRKRKYNVKKYTSDFDQETFLTELEGLSIDPSKIRVVCETEPTNDRDELSRTLDSNSSTVENKPKDSIYVKLNTQGECSQTEPFIYGSPVKKNNCVNNYDVELLHTPVEYTSGCIKKNSSINCDEYGEYDINCIPNNIIPESERSLILEYPKNEEFISIKSDSKENKFLNNYTDKSMPSEQSTTNDGYIDNLKVSTKENHQLSTTCQQSQNTAQSLSTSNFIPQKPYVNYSSHVGENYAYPLESRRYCQNDNISEIFIASQDLFSSPHTDKNASISDKLNSNYNKDIENKLELTSNNLLAIDGEFISQHLDKSYSQISRIGEIQKHSEMKSEFKYGNIKKLREKMELAKQDCINTWNKFIQALEEKKSDVFSLEFQKETKQYPNGYEHHYGAVQKICNEYVNRFSLDNEINKEDDDYVPIESKIKKWCEFQDLVAKIKEQRKRKQYSINNLAEDTCILEKKQM